MKILILQDQLRVGGTERQSLFLLGAFRETGHLCEMVVFRPGGHLWEEAQQTHGPIRVLQSFQSGLSFWAPRLVEAVRASDADVILCMGRSANSYAGYLQRRFPERLVVGTVRTGKALFPLHQWSMRVVKGVLVNSNWWKRRFLEAGFPEERIHVVHNALLTQRSGAEQALERALVRAREQIQPETCVFVNVATFRPGKRHRELLQLVERLQAEESADWRLWLVGDGRELNRCRRWAKAHGLDSRVRFFHYQKDPFPFYAGADVAVSVSREDSLPNFLIEAQSMGLPIIAYDCRGVEETCLPGTTGLILPDGDSSGFLEAMQAMARNPERRRAMGALAPEFAEARFSPVPQARAMLDFFAGLLRNGQIG